MKRNIQVHTHHILVPWPFLTTLSESDESRPLWKPTFLGQTHLISNCTFCKKGVILILFQYIYLPRTKSISLSRLGKWKWGKIYHGQGVWYTRWDNSLTSFVHYIYHQNILTWTFFMVFCTVKDHCTKGWNPLWSMSTSNILIVSYKRI